MFGEIFAIIFRDLFREITRYFLEITRCNVKFYEIYIFSLLRLYVSVRISLVCLFVCLFVVVFVCFLFFVLFCFVLFSLALSVGRSN